MRNESVMGKDDYASSGGALKLKGAKDAGIDKKSKKKKKDKKSTEADPKDVKLDESTKNEAEGQRENEGEEAEDTVPAVPKTEAERKHEEMRRKRLDERLKKEGKKTHKERVEALNKYLSTLSEHHDMPRIGPG